MKKGKWAPQDRLVLARLRPAEEKEEETAYA